MGCGQPGSVFQDCSIEVEPRIAICTYYVAIGKILDFIEFSLVFLLSLLLIFFALARAFTAYMIM